MRVAVSGAHYTGKSTLIQTFADHFLGYEAFEEPYLVMEDSGYEFTHPPTVDDFYAQLECSISMIEKSSGDSIFDRSPLDFLSYALATASNHSEDLDLDDWRDKIEEGLAKIELLVFVPIEDPDLIRVPSSEDRNLRVKVDEKLRELVMEDSLGLLGDIEVLEVFGSPLSRVRQLQTVLNRK